jgi:hypothetical protein
LRPNWLPQRYLQSLNVALAQKVAPANLANL